MTDNAAAARLQEMMDEQAVTEAELASRLGVPQSSVSSHLRGTAQFTIPELYRYAEALGMEAFVIIEPKRVRV